MPLRNIPEIGHSVLGALAGSGGTQSTRAGSISYRQLVDKFYPAALHGCSVIDGAPWKLIPLFRAMLQLVELDHSADSPGVILMDTVPGDDVGHDQGFLAEVRTALIAVGPPLEVQMVERMEYYNFVPTMRVKTGDSTRYGNITLRCSSSELKGISALIPAAALERMYLAGHGNTFAFAQRDCAYAAEAEPRWKINASLQDSMFAVLSLIDPDMPVFCDAPTSFAGLDRAHAEACSRFAWGANPVFRNFNEPVAECSAAQMLGAVESGFLAGVFVCDEPGEGCILAQVGLTDGIKI